MGNLDLFPGRIVKPGIYCVGTTLSEPPAIGENSNLAHFGRGGLRGGLKRGLSLSGMHGLRQKRKRDAEHPFAVTQGIPPKNSISSPARVENAGMVIHDSAVSALLDKRCPLARIGQSHQANG
jgi:hypothetical protein